MAQDATNHISYYLVIDEARKSDLAAIRPWQNLKVAFDRKEIWVKDLSFVQADSTEVKSIPYKTMYYEKNGKLCFLNSLLPERNVPSLLWTPIERALPVKLPSFNHNYFGINEKISVSLVPTDTEKEAEAMITTVSNLKHYIETAPAVRFQKLKWALLNNDKAIIIGKPILPLNGNTYWKKHDCMLPTGFDLDFDMLSESIYKILNPGDHFLIVWDTDNSYSLIDKDDLQALSVGSFRSTLQKHFSYT
ncbi:MAG: hypothetical protein V4506_09300 [Bacteroidota bacterium]